MPAPRPLLYSYRRCPYAMRARMALLLAGVSFDVHEIVLRDKPAAMLALSPKGTVPVLVQADGTVLEQSWDIVRWALSCADAPESARQIWAGSQTAENQTLMELNDGSFKQLLDRYKYPDRFATGDGRPIAAAREAYRTQALALFLEPLEQRLTGTPYLGGDTACATDIGIFPFVRQFAAVDAEWFDALPLVNVQRWLREWLSSELFERCMVKIPANAPQHFPSGIGNSTPQ